MAPASLTWATVGAKRAYGRMRPLPWRAEQLRGSAVASARTSARVEVWPSENLSAEARLGLLATHGKQDMARLRDSRGTGRAGGTAR